jgi:hypothetical protein
MLLAWLLLPLLAACGEASSDPHEPAATGEGGEPWACDALESSTPSGVSRWLFELHPLVEAVGHRHAELVDTGLEGDDSALVLALARSPGGDTVLVASRFDGRAAPRGAEPVLLPRTIIPLAPSPEPRWLRAAAGPAGKVQVLVAGDESAHLLRLDARSLEVEADADLGGGAYPLFLAVSSGGDVLAGLQAPLSPLSLISATHPSLAVASRIGCGTGYTPAAAAPVDGGFLVAFVASACPTLGEGGLWVAEIQGGELRGEPRRLDLRFDPWLAALVRAGDRVWLAVQEGEAGVSTIYALPLDLRGTPLGEPLAVGSAQGFFPTARLGASAVVGSVSHGTSLPIVTATDEFLGAIQMGKANSGPMDMKSIAADTLLTTWGFTGASPEDPFIHIEQLRCTSR